jgi:metal-sulfur cluster biosynthetic enzyme
VPAVPADGGTAGVAPTPEDVMDALSNVIDPELGLDFVELGLIYGVEVNDGNVNVTFTLTTPGCPIGPQVTEQIEEFVGELDGVKTIESQMVFTPPWSPEKMSEDAKFALGY